MQRGTCKTAPNPLALLGARKIAAGIPLACDLLADIKKKSIYKIVGVVVFVFEFVKEYVMLLVV